jgi:hypothetical protein
MLERKSDLARLAFSATAVELRFAEGHSTFSGRIAGLEGLHAEPVWARISLALSTPWIPLLAHTKKYRQCRYRGARM